MSSCGRRDGQRGDSAGTGLGWQRERWKGSSPERAAGGRCTGGEHGTLSSCVQSGGGRWWMEFRSATACSQARSAVLLLCPARSSSSAGSRAGGARPSVWRCWGRSSVLRSALAPHCQRDTVALQRVQRGERSCGGAESAAQRRGAAVQSDRVWWGNSGATVDGRAGRCWRSFPAVLTV